MTKINGGLALLSPAPAIVLASVRPVSVPGALYLMAFVLPLVVLVAIGIPLTVRRLREQQTLHMPWGSVELGRPFTAVVSGESLRAHDSISARLSYVDFVVRARSGQGGREVVPLTQWEDEWVFPVTRLGALSPPVAESSEREAPAALLRFSPPDDFPPSAPDSIGASWYIAVCTNDDTRPHPMSKFHVHGVLPPGFPVVVGPPPGSARDEAPQTVESHPVPLGRGLGFEVQDDAKRLVLVSRPAGVIGRAMALAFAALCGWWLVWLVESSATWGWLLALPLIPITLWLCADSWFQVVTTTVTPGQLAVHFRMGRPQAPLIAREELDYLHTKEDAHGYFLEATSKNGKCVNLGSGRTVSLAQALRLLERVAELVADGHTAVPIFTIAKRSHEKASDLAAQQEVATPTLPEGALTMQKVRDKSPKTRVAVFWFSGSFALIGLAMLVAAALLPLVAAIRDATVALPPSNQLLGGIAGYAFIGFAWIAATAAAPRGDVVAGTDG